MDLRVRRVVAGISQVAIAGRMGVSRQRIGLIEGMLRPPTSAAGRYLEALRAAEDEQ